MKFLLDVLLNALKVLQLAADASMCTNNLNNCVNHYVIQDW